MDKTDSGQILLMDCDIKKSNIAVLNKENTNLTTQEYSDNDIIEMIYTIRGQKVMLDSDLAELYGYELKRLSEQVKRNIERFPEDFRFQLTREELDSMKSQIATSPNNMFQGQEGGKRKLPYVFTEQGAYQLATVLKGPVAAAQSVHIMRVFVHLKHKDAEYKHLLGTNNVLKITELLIEDNIKIKEKMSIIHKKHKESITDIKNQVNSIKENMATKDDIQNILDNFLVNDKVKQFAFFKDRMFEADEFFIKLYSEAKNSIYIIDNYISIKTLSHLKHKNESVEVIIFTNNLGGKDKLRKAEFDDFNIQYPSLSLKVNNLSHDRYIILDYNTENEKIFHSGASVKDAGKKACSINKIIDTFIYHAMIDVLLKHDNLELS